MDISTIRYAKVEQKISLPNFYIIPHSLQFGGVRVHLLLGWDRTCVLPCYQFWKTERVLWVYRQGCMITKGPATIISTVIPKLPYKTSPNSPEPDYLLIRSESFSSPTSQGELNISKRKLKASLLGEWKHLSSLFTTDSQGEKSVIHWVSLWVTIRTTWS